MIDLILEHPTQHGATRKFWLREGEAIRVGRTFRADYTVEQDDLLSPVHFQVQHLGDSALVCDLGSQSGTFCNGQKLDRFQLHDGDVIQAGATCFSTVLKNRLDTPNSQGSSSNAQAALATEPEFHCIDQENGLARIDTDCGVKLLEKLASKFQLMALVNANVCDKHTSSDSWSGRTKDAGCGMAILNLVGANLQAFSKDFSGHDGCTIFASSSDITQRLTSISTVFCRSSNVRSQLFDSPAESTELLLHGVDAVVIESASPGDWHAFAKSAADSVLKERVGLPSSPAHTFAITSLQPSL